MMGGDIGVIAVVAGCFALVAGLFILIVLPIWIVLHYLSKARNAGGLSAQDEKMLTDLWESARRMEERLANLERVLARDAPKKTT